MEGGLNRSRFTSAHWGSYRAEGEGESLRLVPLADDPTPSVIGGGWLAAVRDAETRIAAPMVRKGWLERRDRSSRNAQFFRRGRLGRGP